MESPDEGGLAMNSGATGSYGMGNARFQDKQYSLLTRHRYARLPSLRLRRKEGGDD